MAKFSLWLKDRREPVELQGDRILCNDVIFPGEYNPHKVRLWVIGNRYGALGAVWAGNEQDALDELVDSDLGAGLLVDPDDVTEEQWESGEITGLGNAGEPADLQHAWMSEVRLDREKDCALLMALAEARGATAETLDDY